MTRLFIYEYLSATQQGPPSLQREGRAMLCAIVEDMRRIRDCEITTLLADAADFDLGEGCKRVTPAEEPDTFRRLAREADYTLVIAPETDGILEERSRWVLDEGGRLLGCTPDAVRLCGDKVSLAQHLGSSGIPTPRVIRRIAPGDEGASFCSEEWPRNNSPILRMSAPSPPAPLPWSTSGEGGNSQQKLDEDSCVPSSAQGLREGTKRPSNSPPTPNPCRLSTGQRGTYETIPNIPLVLKPRHGAGMVATYFIPRGVALSEYVARARQECPDDELLLQPLVIGVSVSVSFLVRPNCIIPLMPGHQMINVSQGKGRYVGGVLPLQKTLVERAITLGTKAVQSVGGLGGFVGVDLVLGDSRDAVIEINPRLTTSYLGLRRMTDANLAELWLKVSRGEGTTDITWKDDEICFGVDD